MTAATPLFSRYIGIDYSGAQTPEASLKGLRVYVATPGTAPIEQQPEPVSPKWYWTRKGLAAWLLQDLSLNGPSLIGIDHGFSFPEEYFKKHKLPRDWGAFLDDFQKHWPTDEDFTYVDFIREGEVGNGAARTGYRRWRRVTEKRVGAKSVFHFDVPGSVAKSTHAGLPWLRFLRQHLGPNLHFWPFDGWTVPAGRSVIAEAYPRLLSAGYSSEGRTPDQHDAYSIAAWMRDADQNGTLASFFQIALSPAELKTAAIEGWILGVK